MKFFSNFFLKIFHTIGDVLVGMLFFEDWSHSWGSKKARPVSQRAFTCSKSKTNYLKINFSVFANFPSVITLAIYKPAGKAVLIVFVSCSPAE